MNKKNRVENAGEEKECAQSVEKVSAADIDELLGASAEESAESEEKAEQGRENAPKEQAAERKKSFVKGGVRYDKNGREALFQPFTVKDVVFLAVIGAAALITSAVMPLVAQIPVFGLPQLVTGLQMSLFPTIGLMKVRKPGSVLLVAALVSVLELFMAPAMGVTSLVSALIIEAVNLALFRGYKKDAACFVSGMLINPMTLPFYYLYCLAFETGSVFFRAAGDSPWVAVGVSFAVLAVCAAGAGLGVLISREIRKAGLMKK